MSIRDCFVISVFFFSVVSHSSESRPPFIRVHAVEGIAEQTRAVVLSQDKMARKLEILYQKQGVLQVAKISQVKNDPFVVDSSWKNDFHAFLSDAAFTLHLADRSGNRERAREFYSMVSNLKSGLACILQNESRLNSAKWKNYTDTMKALIAFDADRKVQGVEHYRKLIFSALNPKFAGQYLSSRTLLVPISMEWIRSSNSLSEYFDRVWVKEHKYDLRILGGNSGEGVSGSEKDNALNMLLDLKKQASQLTNFKLQTTDEFKWLMRLNLSSHTKIDRMIFIHEYTWRSKSKGWQEYIPIDQGFGPLPSQPILSVLIHELNVNSGDFVFLPSDTHSMYEDSQTLWAELSSTHTAARMNRSSTLQAKVMGLQPLLGAVYLQIYLPELLKLSQCKI